MKLSEIRQQYPQYDNLSDAELSKALHAKFYPQLDFKDFAARIGFMVGANPAEYDPSSPEYQQKYGPTGSTSENLRAGAGKAFYDMGRGVKQLTGNMSREEVDATKAMDAPLMSTGAGKVGYIGGNVALALPTAAIPGANTYTGAALIGAGLGALQPVGTRDSRMLNSGIGAAGGVAGKFVGDRLSSLFNRAPTQGAAQASADVESTGGAAAAENAISATPEMQLRSGGPDFGTVGADPSAGLTQAQREIAQRGTALGMRMTPGQATGSRALQQFEAKLESQPMTSGPFNAIKENNARAAARAVAQSIGENTDEVSSGVLNRAAERISGVFQSAGDDVVRPIDPKQFLSTYTNIQNDLEGIVSGFGDHPLVAKLTGYAEKGEATGHQLQQLTSKLGKAAYKQMSTQNGDRDLGLALYQVKDYVDDLLMQGMDDAQRATFQQARTQYRNLMMLTSRQGVINPSTGNVSGKSLANLLGSKDKAGFMYGRNRSPIYDAARFAQAFGPIVGDSGTATRAPFQGITEMMMRVPMNIASRAYTSAPAIRLATGAQAAAQSTGNALGPVLGPPSRFAPYYLPGITGVLAPELVSE